MREVSLDECNLYAPKYSYDEIFSLLGGDKLPYGLDDERWLEWRRAKSPAAKMQALHAAPTPPPSRPRSLTPPPDLVGATGTISLLDLIS